MVVTLLRKDLEKALMEPKEVGLKEPGFIIEGDNGERLSVVSSGKNGAEYNKTLGFFHNFPGIEVYHCLYGQGILMMQRNDQEGDCKEVKVVGLRPGMVVEVPSGWGQCLINTGKSFLVVADNGIENVKYHDDQSIKEKAGLAYYVVDRKGNIAFEENPNYSFHPQISPY